MRRDSESARREYLDVRFRKLPEYRRRNRLNGRRGGGGRESAVEVVGEGSGRDRGGERSRFHLPKGGRDGHVSRL